MGFPARGKGDDEGVNGEMGEQCETGKESLGETGKEKSGLIIYYGIKKWIKKLANGRGERARERKERERGSCWAGRPNSALTGPRFSSPRSYCEITNMPLRLLQSLLMLS